MKYMDKKTLNRVKRIIEAQLNGKLNPRLGNSIRLWFMGKAHEEEKYFALEEQWDKHVTESYKKSKKLDVDFKKITTLLGFPKKKYRKSRLTLRKRSIFFLSRPTALRVAAVLLPALFVAGGAYLWMASERDTLPTTLPDKADVVVAATDDTPEVVNLLDGSVINITSGSITHAANFDTERSVRLEGEAHFNVAKDTVQTFTVHTSHLKITVLGTEFKVHSDQENHCTTVDLFHGSIYIETDREALTMHPGQHLHCDHTTKELTLSHIAVGQRLYDRMPNLVFDGGSLNDVFRTIEQEYHVPVRITGQLDVNQKGLRVDLTSAQSINAVMHILSATTGTFTYEITDLEVIVKPRTPQTH